LQKLLILLKRFEGLSLKPYLCPAGIWTIGYGHTGGITKDTKPITKFQAEMLLMQDGEAAIAIAKKYSPNLKGDKLLAIADFIFNLGAARYKASTLRRKIATEDWAGAEEQIQRWVWSKGRKLPGLIIRRAVEAELLRNG
jgi:lysozyme